MGRAKLKMELIKKEKSRCVTFKKRKEGLLRKIHEFTTLCDVSACMIIYGPKQENSSAEADIWPENPDEVSRMINMYKSRMKDSGTRIFGLLDFFQERKKRIEEELEKMRKKNMEIKYPTWIDFMSYLSEIQLREFAATLGNKREVVKSRIEMIEGNDHHHHHIQNRFLIMEGSQQQQQQHQMIDFSYNDNPILSGLFQRGIELDLMNQQAISASVNPIELHAPIHHYPTTIDHQEHHQMHAVHQNSMMMLLMNEDEHQHDHHQLQFNGTANIQCASFKRQVYYESSGGASGGGSGGCGGGGLVDNLVYNHARPLTGYYVPNVQPMVPYMHYPLMPNVSPQLHSSRENEYDDVLHYGMKDQKARF